jgi:hypothetical protein
MKTSTKTFFAITIYLLGIVTVLAAPDPPTPNGRNQGPPPGPGLPIDEHSTVLIILTVFFGMYVVYSCSRKKTNSPSK